MWRQHGPNLARGGQEEVPRGHEGHHRTARFGISRCFPACFSLLVACSLVSVACLSVFSACLSWFSRGSRELFVSLACLWRVSATSLSRVRESFAMNEPCFSLLLVFWIGWAALFKRYDKSESLHFS